MDDLLFKNIPAEGFDPNCGFTDRISNPTPSRGNPASSAGQTQEMPVGDRLSNVQTRDSSVTGYSNITDRLSNATPSRRNGASAPTLQSSYDERDRMSSTFDASRASNPTPSRRAAENCPAETGDGGLAYSVPSVDDYSRASNPTPTRRRQNVFSEPPVTFPNSVLEADEDLRRASNPTPTRRSAVSTDIFDSPYMAEEVESRLSNTVPTRREREGISLFSNSGTAESLTFESADNPYGFADQPAIGDSRASNPTLTRRVSQTQEMLSQEERDSLDDNRLSNYIPSRQK